MHFKTIRTYTAAILDVFSSLEIEYKDSIGNIKNKLIPMQYAAKEKSLALDLVNEDGFINGNVNALPRGSVSLTSISKNDSRQLNRNLKTNIYRKDNTVDFAFNSVAYTFEYEVKIICRGMNEVNMIIEQIAPKFNPTLAIDVFDADNLSEPTRIPVKMSSISFDLIDDFSENSMNLFTVTLSLSLDGNLYQPIKSLSRIREYKERLFANKELSNEVIIPGFDNDIIEDVNNDFDLISFDKNVLFCGENSLKLKYNVTLYDNLKFEWGVVCGNANLISQNKNICVLDVKDDVGIVEIQCNVFDATIPNRVKTISKKFRIETNMQNQ